MEETNMTGLTGAEEESDDRNAEKAGTWGEPTESVVAFDEGRAEESVRQSNGEETTARIDGEEAVFTRADERRENAEPEDERRENAEPEDGRRENAEPGDGTSREEIYRQRAEEDFSEICRAFPEARAARDLFGIGNLSRYAELREAGLPAPEAYAAAHYDRLGLAPMPDSRAHLSSSLGRGAAPAHAGMSAGEMTNARELFPTLTDREIGALYLRASGNRKR